MREKRRKSMLEVFTRGASKSFKEQMEKYKYTDLETLVKSTVKKSAYDTIKTLTGEETSRYVVTTMIEGKRPSAY